MCSERSALSLSQREIYLEYKLAPSSNLHTIGGFIQISGPLDAAFFLRALQDTVEENDTFGIRLCETQSGAHVTYLRPSIEVPILDFSANSEALSEWMRKRFRDRIDILGAPLFEFALLRESPASHYWFIKAHHVIIDGWGISLLGKSVAAKYSMLSVCGTPTVLTPPPYADFVENDLRHLGTPTHVANRSYWREVMAKAPSPLFAPVAGNGSGEISERLADVLNAQTFCRLTDFGVRHGASAFTVLMACLYVFFSRAYLRSDIIFGYPILNRASPDERAKIGLFTRLLPLRVSAAPTATFRELVELVAKAQRSNLRHRRCPLSEMFEDSTPGMKFDVVLSFARHNYDLRFGTCTARAVSLSNESLLQPLSFFVEEFISGADAAMLLDYNLAYFKAEDAARLLGNVKHLLGQVLDSPESKLADFEIAAPVDVETVRERFNATAVADSGPLRLIDRFEAHAAKTPDHEAIVSAGRRLTYKQLDEESRLLAARISAEHPEAIGPVGILLDRNYDTVIAILAVLKAGRYFLPLDPQYPDRQIRHTLEDSGCQIVITRHNYVERISTVAHHLSVDDAPLCEPPPKRVAVWANPVAYVIYTSGSTGTPKGVVVTQTGLLNMAAAQTSHFRVASEDRVLQFASFSFDAAIFELCMALLAGATLVMAPDHIIADPAAFADFLKAEKISLATLPPTYLQVLPRRDYDALRVIITAGEAPRLRDVSYYHSRIEYFNAYGPTESSIWTTICRVVPGADPHTMVSNIGTPIRNLSVWILDSNLKMMPINHFGEICIGGVGVAQGYLNDDERTRLHFVTNPYQTSERLYRSGDRGRWLPDGTLELSGRFDEQLKIRGYRIEPGEIERHLRARSDLRDAAVVGRTTDSSDLELTAYVVVAAGSHPPTGLELRRYLQERLPPYMIPASVGFVSSLPLTLSGKIDRKGLAECLPLSASSGPAPVDGATTPIEQVIIDAWRKELPVKVFGVHDSFFDLGGNSMHAIAIAAKLSAITGTKVGARAILAGVTISRLAAALRDDAQSPKDDQDPVEEREFHEASPAQKQIWIAHELAADKSLYNVQACYEINGELAEEQFIDAVRKTLARHDALRSAFVNRGGVIGFSIHLPERGVFPIDSLDFTHADDACTAEFVASLHTAAFEITRPPLVRACLLRRSASKHLFVLLLHHIVCDWLSIEILQSEIRQLYRAAVSGEPATLDAPPTITAHVARQVRELGASNQHREYWSGIFSDTPPLISLSRTSGARSPSSHAGAMYEEPLCDGVASVVRAKAISWNSTPYSILFAALNVLLYKYTGFTDIVMGTIIAGRESPSSAGVVGCLLNAVAIRTRFQPAESFAAMAEHVRQRLLEAHEHQSYPLYEIVNELKSHGSWEGPPFSVMVDMLFIDRQRPLELGERAAMLPTVYHYGKSKYDLTLYIVAGVDSISVLYEYKDDVFSASSIRTFARRWGKLLNLLLSDDQCALRNVSLDEASSLPAIERVR